MVYHPAKKPWKHQVQALAAMKGKEAFALLMAMRTGKTKVTLDDFGRLEDQKVVDELLIIAPAGVYHTWIEAIDEHVGTALRARLLVHIWSAGDGAEKGRELEKFLSKKDSPRVLIMNVEAFSMVDRAKKLALSFSGQRSSMIVIDESTSIKNPDAKRSKFIVNKLGPLAHVRRILTGLISPKSPMDVFQQFYFLDPNILGFYNFVTFRTRYCIIKKMDFGGRWPAPVIVGYRDVEEIQEKIAPHSFRVTLEDCYDLPDKMYKFRDVTMTKKQKAIYASIKSKATAQISAEAWVSADAVITQMLRLHQVLLGHVVDEEGNFHEIPENRTSELLNLLEEHEGKAIIWCSYDYNVRTISARLEKEYGKGSVARFWGGNRSSREEEETRFKNEPGCLFMVATPDAGGRGRTWTVADLVVYYSSRNNLEHRSQSEERAQGIGKEDKVLYVDMRVPGTVEERIIKGLREKLKLSAMINGDNWKEWLV